MEYFLFGEEACKAHEEGTDAIVTALINGGGITYKADENTTLVDILNQYDGWNAWLGLTQEEYENIEESLHYEVIGEWEGVELFNWLQEKELINEDDTFEMWLHSRGDMVDMVRDNIDLFYVERD